GAAVDQDPRLDIDQRSVASRAVPHPDSRWMAVHMAVKGFLPAVGHLDRPLRSQRQQAGMDLHTDILARAEGAADAGEVEAYLCRWQIEAGGQLLEIGVQSMGLDVEIVDDCSGGHLNAHYRYYSSWF